MIKSIRSKAFRTLAMSGIAGGLALGMALVPQAAHAASGGTITINGSVLNGTCSVTGATGGVNASGLSTGNFTVTLPGVQTSALSAANDVAGNTSFSITLTGCPSTPTGEQVASFFSGSNIATDGNLSNTAGTGAAANVEVQLVNPNTSTALNLNGATAYDQNSPYATISGGGATLTYQAQYLATGAATAGLVTTTVDYTLVYR